jgi:P27 family predicted phage terminase small subunit
MANPGKPAEEKRRIGSRNYKPDVEVIELEKVVGVPEPLRRLEESGLELWRRVWGMGSNWISPNTDIDLLMMVCEQFDERDQLRDYVLTNSDDCRFERSALRELEKSIRSNLSLLGFTPTDRMKLGVAEVKRMNVVEEMMSRINND